MAVSKASHDAAPRRACGADGRLGARDTDDMMYLSAQPDALLGIPVAKHVPDRESYFCLVTEIAQRERCEQSDAGCGCFATGSGPTTSASSKPFRATAMRLPFESE